MEGKTVLPTYVAMKGVFVEVCLSGGRIREACWWAEDFEDWDASQFQ
jgi:hypothetical protein